MSNPTRRGLLGDAAVLAVAPLTSASSQHGRPHPDAELIRMCAEHVVNIGAYNRAGGGLPEGEYDPFWAAYTRPRDAIGDAKPKTFEGMLAKARAAKAEARQAEGEEVSDGTPAADWAWNLVNDLLARGERLGLVGRVTDV